ncbi:MAG TPA: FAD-dependent oxidoreductase [Candidatus Polarisedimenticolia bacterium]|nr:FAD-dependent oxidoreductase [Candidatus Polarisedimenticolia bacterium]
MRAKESLERQSVWTATVKMPPYPPLRQNLRADVCIVGAGIAGLMTAYLLTRAGKSVIVLDDGELSSGVTPMTTAHLSNAIDRGYRRVERIHGEDKARFVAGSHTAAINRIEAIARIEGIDCDFEKLDGYLFLGPDDQEETLDRELQAARRAGLSDVEKIQRAPWAPFDSGPCLRFPNQGQFHPLKYLSGLAEVIEREGGRLFTGTHADQIEGGSPARIKAAGCAVTADAVVVATNTPVNDLVAIHTKQAPYMTYVIGAEVPRGAVAPGLYWDTGDPYHYVRLQRMTNGQPGGGAEERHILIVGGEDHKTGQADDTAERHGRLEAWARERFPRMGPVEYRWGGQVMETIDGLAFIGRNPLDKDNVYIVTGDCGMGMTHGTIGGILLTDLILKRESPWTKLYDPSRVTLLGAGEFAKENLNVAAQYADYLTGGDVEAVQEIPPGSGAVLRRGLSKVAVYRDDKGNLTELSAVCPHLGCIVDWNDAEKTWDCPCHGSRFDRWGKVINGPANNDLSRAPSD